ncbi:MAG: radical SAM protein [Clostridia bacterium]|nr:radical SAM protein [Clostridia bacterium]
MKINLSRELGLNIKKDNTYIIPIFIPHRGCKNECVFCNQRKISGETRDVTEGDIRQEIDKYLDMYKDNTRKKQIAFFGGSFTGLEIEDQIRFLNVANEYIQKGLVENIRISTRPDYISELILKILQQKNVKIIELGVQSMDGEVLKAAKRGHTAEQVVKASNLIKKYGFTLGHQVMVGLPKSTLEKEIYTMQKCIELKPEIVRIYPVYVLKESKLWDMYEDKEYTPLEIEDAVKRASAMYSLCVENGINVIRIGLQTTEEINSKNVEIAGPVCDNYKERVLSYISYNNVKEKLDKVKPNKQIKLVVSSKEVNYVVGNNKSNLHKYNSEYSGKVEIKVKE